MRILTRFTSLLGIAVLLLAAVAYAGPGAQGTNMGPMNPNAQISVTVWITLHNKATLDSMVAAMYDDSSPTYHQFLTPAQFKQQFAPSAKDVANVTSYLAGYNLKVTSVDKWNMFVTATGTVANAQRAFNTEINNVMLNGKMHRMNASEPTASGAAASLISAVQGLNDLGYKNHVSAAVNPETGAPFAGVSPSQPGPDGLFFSADCLRPPELVTFTTGGGTPLATYFGNRYGADITNTQPPNLPSCGYDSAEMQQAYGLTKLYGQGLDGTGQTIVIVDAFGSNTIIDDSSIFNSLNGLPPFTPSNFAIFQPTGPATCAPDLSNDCIPGNWQFETTLDVQWAHSMAPGANIALVLSADDSFTNLDLSDLFAIETGLGNVVSNSFGIPEVALVEFLPSELTVENGIAEIAAALGISIQVSTGDAGDNLALDNADFGINSVSTNANADSPFVTAVGGTSTFLDKKSNIKLQTGWGQNFTRIADPSPNPPTIPPLPFGFQGGAGGGASMVYARPKYQKGTVSGKFRQVPDIAMNADPNTGCEIIVTPDGIETDGTFVEVFGGTSLSAPMFSGVWAIANQANEQAGGGSLGQAAPLLYNLPNNAINDVNITPIDTLLNVSGVIINPPALPAFETPQGLAAPLDGTRFFISTLFQSSSSTRWDVFTFGTDSSLSTGPGWDNVTGLGTPNGAPFIKAVVKEANKH